MDAQAIDFGQDVPLRVEWGGEKVEDGTEGKRNRMADMKRLLEEHFGFSGFRPGQAEVIGFLLEGRSAAAVFPTGSGKSLCYQLPALVLEIALEGALVLTDAQAARAALASLLFRLPFLEEERPRRYPHTRGETKASRLAAGPRGRDPVSGAAHRGLANHLSVS